MIWEINKEVADQGGRFQIAEKETRNKEIKIYDFGVFDLFVGEYNTRCPRIFRNRAARVIRVRNDVS